MQTKRRKKGAAEGRLLWIPTEEIHAGQSQPRKHFDQEGLEELALSIRRWGLLQPLTVRKRRGGYELIAGERRLRAARMVGLGELPCLLAPVNTEEASVLALVENLQRRDLSFVEEAEGISRLIRLFGLSQEEAAARLGKSQSAIANKLRLLRLPADVLEEMGAAGLTERHARALLRLPDAESQRAALGRIRELGMNVAAAESYVEALLRAEGEEKPPESSLQASLESEAEPESEVPSRGPRQRTFVLKDLRLFYNSLDRSLELVRQGGIDADMSRQETEDSVTLTIRICKNREPV